MTFYQVLRSPLHWYRAVVLALPKHYIVCVQMVTEQMTTEPNDVNEISLVHAYMHLLKQYNAFALCNFHQFVLQDIDLVNFDLKVCLLYNLSKDHLLLLYLMNSTTTTCLSIGEQFTVVMECTGYFGVHVTQQEAL